METPGFTGRVIAALAGSAQRIEKTGQVLVAAELAEEFGLVNIDGSSPVSRRPFLGNPPSFSSAVV